LLSFLRHPATILGSIWAGLAGAAKAFGVGPVLHIGELCMSAVSVILVGYVVAVVWRRPRTRTAKLEDSAAVATAVVVLLFNLLDGFDPGPDGWPRAWTGCAAFAAWLVLIAWLNFLVRDAPRLSRAFFKTFSIGAPLAVLVAIFTLAAPMQLAVVVANLGLPHNKAAGKPAGDHAASGSKSKRTNGNGKKGAFHGAGVSGGTSQSAGAARGGDTHSGEGTNGGVTNGGVTAAGGCGERYIPGGDSADPDLSTSFHDLIESDYGPGDGVAGCLTAVEHLQGDRNVEYAFGIDSANERASLSVVTPTTRAVFIAPALDVAFRLMHEFGVVTTSGAQCAGNGSWVLVYEMQGTVALVRALINDDFVELAGPVLYAWLASMSEHHGTWSWPIAASTDVPGIVKFTLVHDVVTQDTMDTIYYDTKAKYAWRFVSGQKTSYYNALGKKVSPALLESLSPHNRLCKGLVPTSNRPIVR
jgi:hypothetical protein